MWCRVEVGGAEGSLEGVLEAAAAPIWACTRPGSSAQQGSSGKTDQQGFRLVLHSSLHDT